MRQINKFIIRHCERLKGAWQSRATSIYFWIASSLTFLAMTLFISPLVHAENIKPEHGMAMYGDLKYDSDFEHFDYTNPDAPKGGELRQHVVGTFDSLNGFILKGNPASGLSMIYDTLMVSSDDEPFSMYGLVAKIKLKYTLKMIFI